MLEVKVERRRGRADMVEETQWENVILKLGKQYNKARKPIYHVFTSPVIYFLKYHKHYTSNYWLIIYTPLYKVSKMNCSIVLLLWR